jgi:hypothetical protein
MCIIVFVQLDMLTKLDDASSPVHPKARLGLLQSYSSDLSFASKFPDVLDNQSLLGSGRHLHHGLELVFASCCQFGCKTLK